MPIDFQPKSPTTTINFQPKESTGSINFQPKETSVERGPKNTISQEEISAIAERHGVPATDLQAIAPFFGANVTGGEPSLAEAAERGLGAVSTTFAFGIPQWIYKKTRPSEAERKAIDDLNQLIEERKPLSETLTEVGAGVATGGALAKGVGALAPRLSSLYEVASAAGSGATAGLARSKEGEELPAAALGGTIGAGLGLIGVGAGKLLGKAIEEKALQKATEEIVSGPEGRNIERRIAEARKATREADNAKLQKILAEEDRPNILNPTTGEAQRLQTDTVDFARNLSNKQEITPQEALEIIDEKVSTEGPEYLAKRWDQHQDVKTAFKVLADDTETKLPYSDNWLSRARDFLVDGKYVARGMDDRLGTNVEVILDDLSQQNNRYTVQLFDAVKKARLLDKEMKAAGLEGRQLFNALDTGSTTGFTDKQQQVYQLAKDIFKEEGELAKQLGVPIKMRTNYVPYHSVELPEAIARIEKRVDDLRDATAINLRGAPSPEEWKSLESNEQFRELQRGLEYLTGSPAKTPQQFTAALRLMDNPQVAKEHLDTIASAVYRREGDIPDFLKEYKVSRLLSNWAQNTFRHAYYRDGISELKRARGLAIAANDKPAADYLHKLVQDLTGVRRGTLNSTLRQKTLRMQVAAKRKLETTKNPLAQSWYRLVAESPDFMNQIFNQVYPNFLGFSPRAAIYNLTQPFFMTVPELGTGYGSRLMMRANFKILNKLMKGETVRLSPELARSLGRQPGEAFTTRNITTLLRNEGNIPKFYSSELRDSLRSGIKESALYKMSDKVLENYTKAALFLFDKTESMNRMLASEMGQQLARDIVKGQKGAMRFVEDMGSGYRRKIQDAVQRQDFQELSRLTKNYLISKTIFNYNRITMNEFGRSLGPIFSVFTKWPASIAGDVLQIMNRKGMLKGSQQLLAKYFAPLLAVGAMENLLMDERTDLTKKIVGHEGLAGASPIMSLKNILEGRILKPPVIATLTSGLEGVINRDPSALWRWSNETAQAFVPGAGLLRFMVDDLPVWQGKPRPKGTLFEKTFPRARMDERMRELTNRIQGK